MRKTICRLWCTTAGVIANEMGAGIRVTSGPAIEKAGDLAALLTNLAVCVLDLAPRMLFLNIGTNDLSDASRPMAQIMGTYRTILEKVLQALPDVQIYLMAYYPINEEAATPEMKPCLRVRTNEKIAQANAEVQKLAKSLHLHYIDVNAPLKDEQGRLRAEFTYEGMHIRPEGYRTIYPAIKKILMNA